MGGIVVAGIYISYHDLVCVFECGMGEGGKGKVYMCLFTGSGHAGSDVAQVTSFQTATIPAEKCDPGAPLRLWTLLAEKQCKSNANQIL